RHVETRPRAGCERRFGCATRRTWLNSRIEVRGSRIEDRKGPRHDSRLSILDPRIPRGDLGLKPQHVPALHARIPQSLIIQKLFAAGAMVKLITEQLPVRRVLWKVHLLQQD